MRLMSTAAAGLIVGLVAFTAFAAENSGLHIGDATPSFSLTDQNGKTVSGTDFASKILVVEWVNLECPFVQRHYDAQTMKKLAEKYKDKGVAWVSIHTGGTAEADRAWAADQRLAYPILTDKESAAARAFGARSTPDLFIINKDGKLAYQGAIDNDPRGDKTEGRVNYVEKALNELLAGKPVSTPETKPYGCGVH